MGIESENFEVEELPEDCEADFFAGVIERHADTVMRVCRVYLKNTSDAEDIFQEVFIKLIEKRPLFESLEHQKAWLIRVAANLSKNLLRGKWFKRAELAEDMPAASESENAVFDAVMALPLKYRRVIYLHYFEGYKTDEIAYMLGSLPGTIRSQLSRARAILREKLKGEFDDEL